MGKKTVVFMGIIMLLGLLLPGTLAAEGMAYREVPLKVIIQEDGAGQDIIDHMITLRPGEGIRVELTYAGGTGYLWTMQPEKPGLVQVIEKVTGQEVARDKNITGGPMKDIYVLQGKAGAAGTEIISFTLRRPWETTVSPAKTLNIIIALRPEAKQ